MKILKTMIAAAVLVNGMVAMAQGPGNRPMRSASERAKMETEMLVKSLEMNAEQTAQVQEINQKYAVKDSISFSEMRKGGQPSAADREAMMKSLQEQRAAKSAEIKAVLTDAQKEKYDAIQKEREQRGPRQGGQGKPENN